MAITKLNGNYERYWAVVSYECWKAGTTTDFSQWDGFDFLRVRSLSVQTNLPALYIFSIDYIVLVDYFLVGIQCFLWPFAVRFLY